MSKKRKAKTEGPRIGSRQALSILGSPQLVAVILIAVIVFVVAVRIRLLEIPLERDEGEFGYMGQLILQGGPLYSAAYNMKLPGIYAVYALIMLLFGQSTAGIRLGLMLANVGTILLMFVLARRLFGSFVGVMAAASYAVMSLSPRTLGLAGHATHFVVLCALGGLVLLLKATENSRWTTLFWSGLLLGLGFTMKQCGAYFVLFGLAYLAWSLLSKRPIAGGKVIGRLVVFAVSSAIPLLLSCLAALLMGEFDKFWFWTVKFPSEYGSLTLREGWANLKFIIGPTIGHNMWLWLLGGIGLTAVVWSRKVRSHWSFLTGFLVFSALSVSSSLYFRDHYFIVILPAISLLASVAVACIGDLISQSNLPTYVSGIPVVAFVFAVGYPVAMQKDIFFTMTPAQVCRFTYGTNPFPEFVEIAKYIREHTNPGDKIAVLGSEAELYFYTRRRAATSYIYTYSLVRPQKYARRMQEEMIRQIESAKPKYIVFCGVVTSWLVHPKAEKKLLDWIPYYIDRHYDMVGLVDIFGNDLTDYYWDDDALGRSPSSPSFVTVFKRKPV
jgi:hypothetical protein